MLTRIPILLAQIKAGNDSKKLKTEIRQILYQHNKITKKVYNNLVMEENMTVIRDPKTFYFTFEWPKDVDENLKNQIEFMIKSNESSSKNKIKDEI